MIHGQQTECSNLIERPTYIDNWMGWHHLIRKASLANIQLMQVVSKHTYYKPSY